jgi:hypothetical protein
MLINSGGAITERDNGEQGRIYEIASKQARGGTSTWHKQGGYHEWQPPCLSFGVMRALWHYKIRLVLMRYY